MSEQSERSRLWSDMQPSTNPLERAMLQSLPGHKNYAPQQAREALQNLLHSGRLDAGEQRLLRLRLLDLRYETYLQQQLQERDQRLNSLISIERDLQGTSPP